MLGNKGIENENEEVKSFEIKKFHNNPIKLMAV